MKPTCPKMDRISADFFECSDVRPEWALFDQSFDRWARSPEGCVVLKGPDISRMFILL